MTTPLPSAHEPLPADFLRNYGAQKGMKYRMQQAGYADYWMDWRVEDVLSEVWFKNFIFCAPIGTIAAATTPLPEPRCDCGCDLGYGDEGYSHLPSCSIHRTYHHILPAALAALPEKPEGLICCRSLEKLPSAKWGDFVYWPIVPDGETPNGFPFADFAYAIPAQSGQGKGKEYRVTCPHCLGQQKANGAVCLECNGIGYWMNPYPLSTQPEGGDATCDKKDAPVQIQGSASVVQPVVSSNAAPANVPTVAGSGQGELDVDAAVQNILGQFMTDQIADSAKGLKPPPPSTAGETPRVDELAPQWARNGITGLRQAIAFARDLERQLTAVTAQHQMAEMEVRDVVRINEQHQATIATLRARLAALEADGQRLDWLEANQRALIPCFGKNPPMGSGLPIPFEGYTLTMTDPTPKPLRSAIDAAMKGDK